ncbi:MAG: pilus assembly protein PilP [Deltaproteobacteria bacterium]|jgi:type IV pilus assembly protein PilP|nr:pilus assembly protein PilP [Deltaproteobacteria bacterium]
MIKKLLLKSKYSSAQINRDKCVNEIILCNNPQKIIPNLLTIAAVFLCALLLAACGKKQTPEPPPAPSPKVVAVQPMPVQKQSSSSVRLSPPTVNQFDFSTKKDPFKPFVAVKTVQNTSPESIRRAKRNSLPIHSFDVNQFKLIGIISSGRENQAMVTDPGGKGYVLKVGMFIGKNDGKIISINSSGVEVLEQFKDDNGRVRKEKIKLTLPRKQ